MLFSCTKPQKPQKTHRIFLCYFRNYKCLFMAKVLTTLFTAFYTFCHHIIPTKSNMEYSRDWALIDNLPQKLSILPLTQRFKEPDIAKTAQFTHIQYPTYSQQIMPRAGRMSPG